MLMSKSTIAPNGHSTMLRHYHPMPHRCLHRAPHRHYRLPMPRRHYRRSTLHRLERWQTSYLPVFALWAAAVVVILPPAFGFA